MVSGQCADVTVPGTNWTFCPDIAPAYAFCALFGLTFVLHVAEGIYYRKAYTWVIAMSALWQTIAYAFRIVSIRTPTSLGDYAIWNVLILVAPLWTNAFVYMAMGRMVWNFTTHAKVLGLTAWSFGTTFVCLDIVYVLERRFWQISCLTQAQRLRNPDSWGCHGRRRPKPDPSRSIEM